MRRFLAVLGVAFVIQMIAVSCGLGFHPQPYGPEDHMEFTT